MVSQRDDFPKRVADVLARRAGVRCCNPMCRQLTSGPQEDPGGAVNVGVAAHITAAAEGGPRYEPNMSPIQRSSSENGIWLCQKCAALIDRDVKRYTVDKLYDWKRIAEDAARVEVEAGSGRALRSQIAPTTLFHVQRDVVYPPAWSTNVRDWQSWNRPERQWFFSLTLKTRWWLTNTTDKPVRITAVLFEFKSGPQEDTVVGTPLLLPENEEAYLLNHEFTGTVHLQVEVFTNSKVLDAELRATGRVVLLDQFGNRYETEELVYERY